MKIDNTPIGHDERPYLIAEVGINARTDLPLAKQFVKLAAESGADAVKFQTHIADAEMVESEMRRIGAGDVYDTVADCQWSVDEHLELMEFCESCDVTFLSTPFSVEAVELLEEVGVPAYKIGSGEMTNRHLLKAVADTGKPLLVSTGMNTLPSVEATAEFLHEHGAEFAMFYCVSEYPTSVSDFEFGTIDTLHELTGVPIGFSDHSQGVEAAKAAIGNGAVIVEKHFTIDRRLPGPDQIVSIEPDELLDLRSFAKLFHETAATRTGLHEEEREIESWAKESLVAKTDIEAGTTLTESHLTTKRPATGIPAESYYEIVGRKTSAELQSGDVITTSDLAEE